MDYSKQEPPEFTGSETGIYEDPEDNYIYENYMNPIAQYYFGLNNGNNNIGRFIRTAND